MNDSGATSGTFETPTDTMTVTSSPAQETSDSPSSNQLQQPSYAGLAGTPAQPTFDTSTMHAQQPQQQPEHPPAAQVARGAFAALSGAAGHPLDWARAMIAGGLTAAANVKAGPPGSGFLAGAGEGFQGVQQRQDQEQAIAAKQQQQKFEQQEKLKQDEQNQQRLDNELKNSSAQRALYTAQTAGAIQSQQQSAARFPTLQAEDQAKYRQLSDQIRQSESDTLSVLSAAGVDVSKLEHITSSDQLTQSHAQQAGKGDVFAVPNGEDHKEGEDGAGAYIVPGSVWDQKTTKPVTITTGWTIDPKTGKATPQTTTAQPGTTVGTLLAIAKGAQNDLAQKQKQIMDQSAAKQAEVKGANAQTDETLHQEAERGSIAHTAAETNQINSQTAQTGALNPPGSQNLQGEQYLATLPQAEQATFKAVSEGRAAPLNLQDRKGNLTPAGQAFMKSFPDYDIAKAKEYPKLVQEFTTGATGKAIVAQGTAINHTRAAYDNTGPASYIPGTAENKRYNADVTFISEELGKYLKAGVAGVDEVHQIQDALKSNVPWIRKPALENAAHIIAGRRSESEQQWKNGQVRPSYQPPMPNISKEAEDNLAYLQSGGKRTSAAEPPPRPQAATMQVPGSDGKLHWSDGKNDLGVVGAHP